MGKNQYALGKAARTTLISISKDDTRKPSKIWKKSQTVENDRTLLATPDSEADRTELITSSKKGKLLF